MSASPARSAARETVSRVRERAAYAHETLDSVLRERRLPGREVAFATRLAYGTIACRGTLDETVARFLNDPGSLEPQVSDALAVSAYELLFASTPARAAVNEGVELVKDVQPRAAGLANAVLRRVADDVAHFPWGDPDTGMSALARKHCHPEWLADLLVSQYGRETAIAIMQANNEPAPLFLAHLPIEADFESVFEALSTDGAQPRMCVPDGCIVADAAAPAVSSAAVRSGNAIIVDAGAQFVANVATDLADESIVELGAGRGTKTLIMAGRARAHGRGLTITAVDTHRFKLDVLTKTADKLGIPGIHTVCADATSPSLFDLVPPGQAGVVLVDAPCSGLGTLRRHPDRRWRARLEEIDSLSALAARLLDTAALLVKPGGFVVYSTCTVVSEENADVVEGFLSSEAGEAFSVVALSDAVPESWRRFVGPQGYFQSLPERGGPDGHFVATLRRDR